MFIKLSLSLLLLINSINCQTISNIDTALKTAQDSGLNRDEGVEFIRDAFIYKVNSPSQRSTLSKNSLLASNIIKLNKNFMIEQNIWADTKLMMAMKAIDSNINSWGHYLIDVLFPASNLNGAALQVLINEMLNGTSSLNESSTMYDVANLFMNALNVTDNVSNVVMWILGNSTMISTDPDSYIKTIVDLVVNGLEWPSEVEEFGSYILNNITIPTGEPTDVIGEILKTFANSPYAPDCVASPFQIIFKNDANEAQFFNNSMGANIAMQWYCNKAQIAAGVPSFSQDEWIFISGYLDDYLFSNFTAWLYIDNPGFGDYIITQTKAWINSRDALRQGFKDLYIILLDLFGSEDETAMATQMQNLLTWVSSTDVLTTEAKALVTAIFDMENSDVVAAYITYLNTLSLTTASQTWVTNTLTGKTMADLGTVLSDPENIRQWAIVLIQTLDQDDTTFPNSKWTNGLFPNNMLTNLMTIADNAQYIATDPTKFTTAVYTALIDMYPFEYPTNAFLNAGSQIAGLLLTNMSAIGADTNQFLIDCLTIVENTFTMSTDGQDLVDIAQLFLASNTMTGNVTLDTLITWFSAQNKDIATTFAQTLTVVNGTLTVIMNCGDPCSIQTIIDAADIFAILPFASDFVSATVGTLDADLGTRMANVIDAMYTYSQATTVTETEIEALIKPQGLLWYGVQSEATLWTNTMSFVDTTVSNVDVFTTNDELETAITSTFLSPTKAPTTPYPTNQFGEIPTVASSSPSIKKYLFMTIFMAILFNIFIQ